MMTVRLPFGPVDEDVAVACVGERDRRGRAAVTRMVSRRVLIASFTAAFFAWRSDVETLVLPAGEISRGAGVV
jgi:hypothetical protein